MSFSAPKVKSAAQQQAEAEAAAERERQRIQGERNTRADTFLTDNAITDDFRNDITAQSNAAADIQAANLEGNILGSLQDIRQRNAGRGLSNSSSGRGITDQAEALGAQSRLDIFNNATTRATDRITQQQAFLDTAARNIRSGQPLPNAQSQFRTDIDTANKAFESTLTKAKSGDQRNAAFQQFESDRRSAAARFNESVNQFQQSGQIAAASGAGQLDNNNDETSQVTSFPSSLV